MAVSRAERVLSRRIIRRMIKLDRSRVSFIRVEREPDGEGGHILGDSQTLDPQDVSIVPFKRRMVNGILVSDFGQVEGQSRTLIGEVDLDIRVGDTFDWKGGQYEVAEIEPILDDIHTIARVEYLGQADIHG